MISRNLRHLRVFLAVTEKRSITQAAAACNVSQPAVTQSIRKLEKDAGGALFRRTRLGFFSTPRGEILATRVRRACALLDPALADVSARLKLTANTAQLNALVAVQDAESFSLAARRLGLAQPTVHRAVSQLEQEAGRSLFQRTSFGLVASRQCQALAQAAQLAFSELVQADAELAELDGAEAGRIVIGSLPLARSAVLPSALVEFRKQRPTLPLKIVDGTYNDLLTGLRRGEIDFLIGALRDPLPVKDIVQEHIFDDRLVFLAGNHHPLAKRPDLTLADLTGFSWVVPRVGTPSRRQFDAVFGAHQSAAPNSIIETGSVLLMREILTLSNHLGCISDAQSEAEISNGLLSRLNFDPGWPTRPIGLTYRDSWSPTKAQEALVSLIRKSAANRTSP